MNVKNLGIVKSESSIGINYSEMMFKGGEVGPKPPWAYGLVFVKTLSEMRILRRDCKTMGR